MSDVGVPGARRRGEAPPPAPAGPSVRSRPMSAPRPEPKHARLFGVEVLLPRAPRPPRRPPPVEPAPPASAP